MPPYRKSEETIFFRKQKWKLNTTIWAQEQLYNNNASLISLIFVEGNPTWYLFSIGFYGISYHSSALSNFKRIPIGWHNVMNVSIKIFGATHVQLCTTCMSLHSRLQAGDLKKKSLRAVRDAASINFDVTPNMSTRR